MNKLHRRKFLFGNSHFISQSDFRPVVLNCIQNSKKITYQLA